MLQYLGTHCGSLGCGGVLGRSGELLGPPGAMLPFEWGPRAPGHLILSAPGIDFRRFTAVIPRVAPRMMRTTFARGGCAQHLELDQLDLDQ